MKRSLFIFLPIAVMMLLYGESVRAQNPEIIVSGRVTDFETLLPISRLQIFNIRSGETNFSDSSGRFVLHILKRDSLFFSNFGYSYQMACYKDSALRTTYYLNLKLKKIGYELPNVNVYTKREFESIQHEAQKLGYNKNDYMLHGYEVFQSPITALWQQFSKVEKDKREYAQLMDTYRKNELLKEILRLYAEQGEISIPDDQIDLFIDYCNIPEQMLQQNSGYDIVMYMKTRVDSFEAWLAAQKKKVGKSSF